MSDKLPPINSGVQGWDLDPGPIFYAVGGALNAWETMESHFSQLYSIFIGEPRTREGMRKYGDGGRILDHRVASLQRAAEGYFIANPDQEREGEFRAIVANTRNFAIMRHRIAHGQINSVTTNTDEGPQPGQYLTLAPVFFLTVPPHSMAQLGGEPFEGMGSRDILRLASRFSAIGQDAAFLANALHPVT